MDKHNLTRSFLWQIGKTFIAIAITLIVGWLGVQLELRHRVLLALGIFIGLSIIEILWLIKKVDNRLINHHEIWVFVNDIDSWLSSIRSNFRFLKESASGEKDLFIRHFNESVRKLNKELDDTVNSGRLITNINYFLNIDHALDAFNRTSEKIWRFTWHVDNPTELLTDRQWVAWFRHCVDLLQQKKLDGIKTIIIVETDTDGSHHNLERLYEFYRSVANLECNITTRLKFENACHAMGVDEKRAIDMGLYGDGLLYLNYSYEPEILGIFDRNKEVIERHKTLFDNICSSRDYSDIVANKKKNQKLTFDELLAATTSS